MVYFVRCDNGILVYTRKLSCFLEIFTEGCRGKMKCYQGNILAKKKEMRDYMK